MDWLPMLDRSVLASSTRAASAHALPGRRSVSISPSVGSVCDLAVRLAAPVLKREQVGRLPMIISCTIKMSAPVQGSFFLTAQVIGCHRPGQH